MRAAVVALLFAAACAEPSPVVVAPESHASATAASEPAPRKDCGTPDRALMLVLDRSGSMTGPRLETVKDAARRVVVGLSRCDVVEVVAFDSEPRVVVPPTKRLDLDKIRAGIDGIQAGGGTEFVAALQVAHEHLGHIAALRRHVLFVTDGVAPWQGVADVADAMAADGMTLSACAVGEEPDVKLLTDLANRGKGVFVKAPTPKDIPDAMSKALAPLFDAR
jgi:Mg-chelatase subunit ChlD